MFVNINGKVTQLTWPTQNVENGPAEPEEDEVFQNGTPSEEQDDQKMPDSILNTVMKSAKGGGPKPFSYGIDLSELKKKMGPPTAPKPRKGQEGYQEPDESYAYEAPRQNRGPPRKPAGQIQSDYFIPRDDQDAAPRVPKKPAGQVQSDFFLSRDTGPRAEIDESPINLNMGTNPKKQSKSFKVLQWMTETEKDDPEGKKAAGGQTSVGGGQATQSMGAPISDF